MLSTPPDQLRILAVDDEPNILDVYRDSLAPILKMSEANLCYLQSALYRPASAEPTTPGFNLTCHRQGADAVADTSEALAQGRPYAVAFLDQRMPPGEDGVWTARELRRLDPDLEIVIVTGHLDLDPAHLAQSIQPIDKLFYVQKPFLPQEIKQFALALSYKWYVARLLRSQNFELTELTDRLKQEIAERKRTEEALRLLKAAIDHTTEATLVATAHPNGGARIIYVNRSFTRLTGYAAVDIVNKPLTTLYWHHSKHNTAEQLEEQLRENGSFHGETMVFRKNGQSFINEWRIDPVLDLEGKLTHWVAVMRDVTEARQAEQQIVHQATHDHLTGLVNRQAFNERLERVVENARKQPVHHVLCYLDLDRFKTVNDTAGHQAGDQLLRQVVHLMLKQLRSRDTLARIGGDEFGLLLENCPLNTGLAIADSLIKVVCNFNFVWEEYAFKIGVSIGLTHIDTTAVDAANLLRQADLACYAAKRRGRNRACVFTSTK